MHVFSKPILIENMTMFVSCSIGISMHQDDIDSYHDLIKYADTAMYKAKEKGRNKLSVLYFRYDGSGI